MKYLSSTSGFFKDQADNQIERTKSEVLAMAEKTKTEMLVATQRVKDSLDTGF